MGAIYVDVTIRNPADTRREWRGRFLVDTRAFECHIPRHVLETIGLSAKSQRTYSLADGRIQTLNVTSAELEFMGELAVSDVIICGPDTEPTLGRVALASANVVADPQTGTLRKLPTRRMVGLRAATGGNTC